jgi:membrane fusion protein, multidrug efflux system
MPTPFTLHRSMRFAPLSILSVLSLSLVLGACTPHEAAQEPIRAVRVLTVEADGIHSGHEFAGEVRARVESALGFRVAGKMVRRQAELGQRVQAGQVLAQLDPQDYQLAAEAARAQLAAASTQRDLAAADFKRYQELRNQNFISSAELERHEAALKAAQAQWDQARAQLSGQGNQTRYTTLVADVPGVVTAVLADAGQVVAAGTPVLHLAQDGARDVVFAVPEDQVAAIKVGSAVEVKVWSTDSTVQGQVREVAASADPVTRTYTVKVGLDAKDALPLGSTVSVRPQALDRSGVAVVKLPTSALFQAGGGTAVWVLDMASMTLKQQPIQVSTADGNLAVVTSGLQPGMRVVSAGVHVLSAGQKVTIYQEKIPPAPAESAQAATKTIAKPQ